MGKRDYRHRETKKPKKGDKKVLATTIMPLTPKAEVEVIRKRKRREEEEEEAT
ncbi:MAG: hypothetical protein V1932_06330 [Chloroflexota bacterium]